MKISDAFFVGKNIEIRRPLKIVFMSSPDRMTFVEATKMRAFDENYKTVKVRPDQTVMMRVAYGRMQAAMLRFKDEMNGKREVIVRSNHSVVNGERINVNDFLNSVVHLRTSGSIDIEALASRNEEFEPGKILICWFRGNKVQGFSRKWVGDGVGQVRPSFDGRTPNAGGVFPFVGARIDAQLTRRNNRSNGDLILNSQAPQTLSKEPWQNFLQPLLSQESLQHRITPGTVQPMQTTE
jgi:hypothetical protein